DLKVYQTVVTIEGTHTWLKPGMSAKVEILVNELADVIYVPLQAIKEDSGKQFCSVVSGRTQLREVQIGDFNDEFIEIKGGLQEGERVALRSPQIETKSTNDKAPEKKNENPPAKPPATPAKTDKAAPTKAAG